MANKDDRLAELKDKEELSDAEMEELVRLSPPGSFLAGPAFSSLGMIDVDKAFENLKEGPARSQRAWENGSYLEVISLRLQHAELWLRMFWVAKNRRGRIFDPNDKRTFGMIINDCKNLGFDASLINRLKDFNENRVDAIHKYLLGGTDYDELKTACEASKGLDKEVGEYVWKEVGTVITSLSNSQVVFRPKQT